MEEVTEILALPIGTVKSRLYAARNLLKKKIVEYEKREGIELDFKEITPGILTGAMYAAADSGIKKASSKGFLNWMKQLFTGNMLQGAAIAALSLVVLVAGTGGVLSYLNQDNTTMRYLENEQVFEPIELDGVMYYTPYQVYYSLLVFAHCEVELQAMNKQELYHFKPLYDALKASNGSYYHRLQQIGWEEVYLNLL